MTIKDIYDILSDMDDNCPVLVDEQEIGEIAAVLCNEEWNIKYIDIRPIKETA